MPLDKVDEEVDEEENSFGEMYLTDNQKAFDKVEGEYLGKKDEMMIKEYTRNRSLFEENGYVVVARDFVSPDMADIFAQYALFEMVNNEEPNNDGQVPGAYSEYANSLAETLLIDSKFKVECHTGKKLIPTYSYYRVYKAGDVLEDHKDRPACEISATIMMGFRYACALQDGREIENGYNWALHGYVNGEKKYFPHSSGGAVIYKGCELEHGRDKFDVGEYSYQVQVFLHYVDANGPYAKEWAFDKRPSVGIKKETIDRVYSNDTTDC